MFLGESVIMKQEQRQVRIVLINFRFITCLIAQL
jgi:hypothetical protein